MPNCTLCWHPTTHYPKCSLREYDPNDVWSDCPACWAEIKHRHAPPWPLGPDEGGEG